MSAMRDFLKVIKEMSAAGPIDANDQAVEAELENQIDAGERDVITITDTVFWRIYPGLNGKRLEPGSEDAEYWLFLRDNFVVPALNAVAPPAPASGDIYRTQNDNLYAPGDTCNMTSLSMSLLSMAGGDEIQVKKKVADALRRLGKPLGNIKIDDKYEDMLHVFDTPALLAKVQLEDLLTTLGNLKGLNVSLAGSILDIAEATGVATNGKAGGLDNLNDPAVRKRIGEHVRSGQRVLLGIQGGPGHYIYLVEMLADGLIGHDPAGCRCQYDAPFFLNTGARSPGLVQTWMNLLGTAGWPEAARRRLSRNPTALGVVDRLLEARKIGGKKQAEILKELSTGATLNMGENNYYSLDDMRVYAMDVRVEMQA